MTSFAGILILKTLNGRGTLRHILSHEADPPPGTAIRYLNRASIAAMADNSQQGSHPSEDQKKALYEGLSDDQKKKQTYTEWVKDAYNNQYENWMPWIEDKYLAWFGTDNKASYATKVR